jgi:hypothetical protein
LSSSLFAIHGIEGRTHFHCIRKEWDIFWIEFSQDWNGDILIEEMKESEEFFHDVLLLSSRVEIADNDAGSEVKTRQP